MQKAQVLKQFGISHEQFEKLLTEHGVEADLKLMRVVPDHLVALLTRSLEQPTGDVELLGLQPSEEQTRLALPNQLAQSTTSLAIESKPISNAIISLPSTSSTLSEVVANGNSASRSKEAKPPGRQFPPEQKQPEASELRLGQVVEIVGEHPKVYGFIRNHITGERQHIKIPLFSKHPFTLKEWVLFALSLEKAGDKPAREVVSWIQPVEKNVALVQHVTKATDSENLYSLLKTGPDELRQYVVQELISRLPPIENEDSINQTVRTLRRLWGLVSSMVQGDIISFLKRTAPEYGWKLWLELLSHSATNDLAYTAQEVANLADLLADIPEVVTVWLPHVDDVEALYQLLKSVPAAVHPAIGREVVSRLPPITDANTYEQAIQTLYRLRKLLPETAQVEAQALYERTAPEHGWKLWLRFLSPLAQDELANNSHEAARLANLLARTPEAVGNWQPQEHQADVVGLCLRYVQQNEEQVTSLFKQLQDALGEHELYATTVARWLEQLEAIITEQEFLQCQHIARTAPQTSLLTDQELFELAVPDVQLKVWNRVSGVVFPQEAAIAYFNFLPTDERDQIAAQLDDDGFAQIAWLLTTENNEVTRQRARNQLDQQVLADFAALGLDLESDGQTIREISWGAPGSWHTGKGKEDVGMALQELRERVAEDRPYLLAGHNVRDFDAGVLALHDVPLPPTLLWDTLLVEMGLSPDWRVLALQTKHEAEYDANWGLELFINQVLRLRLASPIDWATLRHLLPTGAQEVLNGLRKMDSPPWLIAEVLRQEALMHLRPQPEPSTTLKELREAVAQAQAQAPVRVVVAAREFWRELYAELGLRFGLGADTDVDYQPLVEADVLARLAEHPVEEALAKQFFSYCQRAQLVPVPATMAPALRFRLQQLVDFSECQAVAEPDWHSPQFICLTAQQLRTQAAALMKVQAELFVVEPDLIILSNKELLCPKPLSMDELLASPATRVAAVKFSGGQSFMSLSRTQAEELGAAVPADTHNLWLEKHRQDEYRVWGSFGWEKLLSYWEQRGRMTTIRSANREFPKQSMRSAVVDTLKLQRQLGTTTCNPETNYRAHYWLLQADLLINLSKAERRAASQAEPAGKAEPMATVLLVQRPEEIPALENYFRGQYQYFIPQRASALGRRLELLHQHSSPRRLLIAPVGQSAALLEANYLGPLRVVLESFNLLENFYLAQDSHLFQQAQTQPGKSAEDEGGKEMFESQPETGEEVPDEEDEPTEEASSDPARYAHLEQDVFFLLKLQQPVVQQLRAQLADNHDENQLWLLDPRLADFPDLEQTWQMRRRTYEASWRTESDYREADKTAHLALGGPQAAQDFTLDLVAAKNLLQQIFLNEGEWYDYQHPYLDKILAAKTDVLVSLPTGGGKSLLFQAPALYRSAYTNRLSIVVTPLKALMQDQVQKLWELGFHSSVEAINQDNLDELPQIYRRLAGGEIRLLFITPERFRSGAFIRAFESRMANDEGLEYAVYDEAHCISQWGHEFRPDYLYSAQVMQDYRKKNLETTKRGFPVLLFSATVSEKIYEGFNQLFS